MGGPPNVMGPASASSSSSSQRLGGSLSLSSSLTGRAEGEGLPWLARATFFARRIAEGVRCGDRAPAGSAWSDVEAFCSKADGDPLRPVLRCIVGTTESFLKELPDLKRNDLSRRLRVLERELYGQCQALLEESEFGADVTSPEAAEQWHCAMRELTDSLCDVACGSSSDCLASGGGSASGSGGQVAGWGQVEQTPKQGEELLPSWCQAEVTPKLGTRSCLQSTALWRTVVDYCRTLQRCFAAGDPKALARPPQDAMTAFPAHLRDTAREIGTRISELRSALSAPVQPQEHLEATEAFATAISALLGRLAAQVEAADDRFEVEGGRETLDAAVTGAVAAAERLHLGLRLDALPQGSKAPPASESKTTPRAAWTKKESQSTLSTKESQSTQSRTVFDEKKLREMVAEEVRRRLSQEQEKLGECSEWMSPPQKAQTKQSTQSTSQKGQAKQAAQSGVSGASPSQKAQTKANVQSTPQKGQAYPQAKQPTMFDAVSPEGARGSGSPHTPAAAARHRAGTAPASTSPQPVRSASPSNDVGKSPSTIAKTGAKVREPASTADTFSSPLLKGKRGVPGTPPQPPRGYPPSRTPPAPSSKPASTPSMQKSSSPAGPAAAAMQKSPSTASPVPSRAHETKVTDPLQNALFKARLERDPLHSSLAPAPLPIPKRSSQSSGPGGKSIPVSAPLTHIFLEKAAVTDINELYGAGMYGTGLNAGESDRGRRCITPPAAFRRSVTPPPSISSRGRFGSPFNSRAQNANSATNVVNGTNSSSSSAGPRQSPPRRTSPAPAHPATAAVPIAGPSKVEAETKTVPAGTGRHQGGTSTGSTIQSKVVPPQQPRKSSTAGVDDCSKINTVPLLPGRFIPSKPCKPCPPRSSVSTTAHEHPDQKEKAGKAKTGVSQKAGAAQPAATDKQPKCSKVASKATNGAPPQSPPMKGQTRPGISPPTDKERRQQESLLSKVKRGGTSPKDQEEEKMAHAVEKMAQQMATGVKGDSMAAQARQTVGGAAGPGATQCSPNATDSLSASKFERLEEQLTRAASAVVEACSLLKDSESASHNGLSNRTEGTAGAESLADVVQILEVNLEMMRQSVAVAAEPHSQQTEQPASPSRSQAQQALQAVVATVSPKAGGQSTAAAPGSPALVSRFQGA